MLLSMGILIEKPDGFHVKEIPVQTTKYEQGNQSVGNNFYNFILDH